MSDIGVAICTPSTGFCRSAYAFSLARLSNYFSRVQVFPEGGNQLLGFQMVDSSGIKGTREEMVEKFLASKGTTHLLFIDEDMGFDADCLHIMLRRRLPIVLANYRKRVPPSGFTAGRADKSGMIETTEDSSGLEEAYYGGFGFALFERRVFEATKMPRFNDRWDPVNKGYTTEDFPFYEACRKKGIVAYVDHDASKKIWHVGTMDYFHDKDYSELVK